MVTLGLRTFIINPFLNKPHSDRLELSSDFKDIASELRYTEKAKYKRYSAPKILMALKISGLSLITADTPKAKSEVCTRQPVIKPAMVASPYFLPLVILCINTKILSGPGEIAKANVADANANKVS